jgi:PAT family beta-lactamase induction signal transducer AmpG
MLQRFSPLGKREPEFQQLAEIEPRVLSRGELIRRAVVGGLAGFAVAALAVALLDAFKQQKAAAGFDLLAPLAALFAPADISDWVSLFGVTLFSIVIALAAAATAAARSKRT